MTRPVPLAVIALVVLLTACGREMTLSVVFDTPAGLDAGSAVYLGDAQVGEVSRLTVAGGETRAEVSLDPDRIGTLRSGSAALLARRDGRTVIELYNYRPGTEPLKDGGELVGLNNSLEFAAWQAGEALDTGRQTMDEMSRSVTEYFESDAWQRQKENMNRQMEGLSEELGRAYERTDRAYQDFMTDLENESEGARERARESYAELARRLREQIARLREEGNERIVEPLQRLLEDLSRAMERKPEQEST